jgi:YD repeat-containing protein
MPAPLLILESSVADDQPLFTLDPALVASGFSTAAVPTGYSNIIEILASGSVPGWLNPGESETVPVYYAAMELPWNFSESQFKFDLRAIATTDTDSVDWSQLQNSLLPANVSAAAWSPIYAAVTAQLGSTWGGLVSYLDQQAAYVGQLQQSVIDARQLWLFALAQADNELGPSEVLANPTDISVATADGTALSFNREYQTPLVSRYAFGPLGYGWRDNWQYSLSAQAGNSQSAVIVTMPSGAKRYFQPDSLTGQYDSQPGDGGKLQASSAGGYLLTEANGQIEHFTAAGLLDYVQDPAGKRVTAAYTNGQLTSLTATSGEWLHMHYSAAGLLDQVTSSDGQSTTYNYDPTNQYLTSVQNAQTGLTGGYTYQETGSAARLHALTSIQFADNTHEYFGYDPQGRLSTTAADNNTQKVTYTYQFGEVDATDATGQTTEYFYDQYGQLAKQVGAGSSAAALALGLPQALAAVALPAAGPLAAAGTVAAFNAGLGGHEIGPDQPLTPTPPGGSDPGGATTVVNSEDPNSLVGPSGIGTQNYLAATSLLAYQIKFQNASSATGPAQQVVISDPLDPHLDLSSFQLTGLGFGNNVVAIPPGQQDYQTTLSLTLNGTTLDVAIDVWLDTDTRQVHAVFQSLDPATSLPPAASLGFLPPEDGTGRGTGYISYVIDAAAGVTTGTQIRNVAAITFDGNPVITTDQVNPQDASQGLDPDKQALVTIDAAPPTSRVSPLPEMSRGPSFTVSWSGQDDTGGSGIRAFNIWVSDNGGPYTLWQTNTANTSAVFSGQTGHTYAFYSQAIDNVGNVEATHATADSTTTAASAPPEVVDVSVDSTS